MDSVTGTKQCPFCAEDIKVEAILCRFCGKSLNGSVTSSPTPTSFTSSSTVSSNSATDTQGMGFSIGGLIIAVIGIVIALVDIGFVTDGTYTYIEDSEIGLLAVISFTALGLSIGASSKKQKAATAALILSVISILLMFVCASYTL